MGHLHDEVMFDFCIYFEKRMLALGRHCSVGLKRLANASPWMYIMVLTDKRGIQEAYEIDASTAQWHKYYG